MVMMMMIVMCRIKWHCQFRTPNSMRFSAINIFPDLQLHHFADADLWCRAKHLCQRKHARA